MSVDTVLPFELTIIYFTSRLESK